jgi:dihydrofolate reductase
MAKLIYAAITSLDGYVADESGGFGWAAPDDEVHRFVNDQERVVGTYLYGRRMYDVMRFWQDADLDEADDEDDPGVEYAALWRDADKVVFSRTLDEVTAPRTRLEPSFDAASVRRLVQDADHDVSIGGPTLAAEALRAGLVDDVHLFLNPVVVGGGTPALPSGLKLELQLVDEHRFAGGVVHLHHQVVRAG